MVIPVDGVRGIRRNVRGRRGRGTVIGSSVPSLLWREAHHDQKEIVRADHSRGTQAQMAGRSLGPADGGEL